MKGHNKRNRGRSLGDMMWGEISSIFPHNKLQDGRDADKGSTWALKQDVHIAMGKIYGENHPIDHVNTQISHRSSPHAGIRGIVSSVNRGLSPALGTHC